MAINNITNTASLDYDGSTILSNSVETLLDLLPTIVKVVDKTTAKVDDILTYTMTVTNLSLSPIYNVLFKDPIATGGEYVANSFKVDDVATTPTLINSVLNFAIPSIAALGVVKVEFQVKVIGGS